MQGRRVERRAERRIGRPEPGILPALLTQQGRMGNPDDLKGAVVYLSSDAAKYTTGSELVVDGAYTCV